MLRALAVFAVLSSLALGSAQAQAPDKAPAGKATPAKAISAGLPELSTWTMDNGLQVAFLPIPSAPSVTVQLWYRVGSKDEARNRRGSAHMFEHMMFKGTEHLRAEEHAQHLSQLGGYVNAFTTEDVTAYHNTLPAEYLDFAIKLEAERMRNLWFREPMIAMEKEVVKEEIRQQENNPVYKGFLRFLEIAFTKHPYSWTAGGDLADLDATTLEDLKAFYNRYYVPNNALLVVVGKADRAAVEASAQKWFGPLEKGEEPPRPAADSEPLQTERRREVVDPSQLGVIITGYHIPAASHEDMHALQVLALILSGGESSRLYEDVVRKQKLAVQAGGQLIAREHPGLFMVFGVFLDPAKGEALEKSLAANIARLRNTAPSKAELSKAKNQLTADFVFGMESITGIASQIGNSWIEYGDPKRFLDDLEAYKKVTAADVKRVAQTYLKDEQSTVVIIPPGSAPAKPGSAGAN